MAWQESAISNIRPAIDIKLIEERRPAVNKPDTATGAVGVAKAPEPRWEPGAMRGRQPYPKRPEGTDERGSTAKG